VTAEPESTELEPAIPSPVLEAISYPAGGRVVLVIGAGSSVEAPTNLPLAGALAVECHRKLVLDNILGATACDSPEDLSAVADAVFAATSGQRELVERFPPDEFRHAQPNEGHRIAAALMREGAISNVVSLNFDLAQDVALTNAGAGAQVAHIGGPEDHHRLGSQNLIYLHRSIAAPADDLILRTDPLKLAWDGGWEQIMAERVIGASLTLFVGLGSPTAVLVESAKRIVAAIGDRARMYVVDPAKLSGSAFFAALELDSELYVRLGWTQLMRGLGYRVVEDHRAALERACAEMATDNGWASEPVDDLCRELAALGLCDLGRVRARWLLRDDDYAHHPREAEVLRLLADLTLAIAILARQTSSSALIDAEGIVELQFADRPSVRVLACSGGGSRRWPAVETRARFRAERLGSRRIAAVVVTGVAGERTDLALPTNLVGESDQDSVVTGPQPLTFVTADQLRADPAAATALVA
jgi:hypothetical protein